MEKAEQSNEQAIKSNGNQKMPSATRATLGKLRYRQRGRGLNPGTKSIILDNTSPGYGWLLPGWVAEERHMESGRVYRYYYDPEGCLYRSQHEVIHAWEESGLVVIDA